MSPQRISVKLFIKEPAEVQPARFIPVFHRWIQEEVVPGLLIDVADYKHVHEGPGVLLVGHQGDYAIDLVGGRPGLLYRGKRDWPPQATTWPERLRHTLLRALQGATALAAEPGLAPPVRFYGDRLQIQVADRLRAPNEPDTVRGLQEEAAPLLETLFAGQQVDVSWPESDPRWPVTLQVTAAAASDLEALLHNVSQPLGVAAGEGQIV